MFYGSGKINYEIQSEILSRQPLDYQKRKKYFQFFEATYLLPASENGCS